MSLLKRAKLNKKHYYDILNALEIAWVDTMIPSTKRSYRAAEKAFQRLVELAKESK